MKCNHCSRLCFGLAALTLAPGPSGTVQGQVTDGHRSLSSYISQSGWCGTRVPEQATKAVYSLNLWPNSTLFYEFDASVSPANQQAMLDAMVEISTASDVQFVERTTELNFVMIQDFDGGYNFSSAVGMSGGMQTIGIQSWHRKFVMVHELFHALGMWHEQSRADRDGYIRINSENIESGSGSQFAIVPSAITNGPYDFDSIMHYNQFAFSTGSRTITVLPPYRKRWQYRIGIRDRAQMGSGDTWVLSDLYGGSPPPRVFELTTPTPGELVGEGWTPAFAWEAADMADDYRLLVDDDALFASPEIDVTAAATAYAHDVTLTVNRLYYWTVEARNAIGASRPFLDGTFFTASLVPQILYVDDDALPGGTGASWDEAFRDLQDALALAENVEREVVEIRVAEGSYRPDRGTGNRASTFDLVSGVTVRGGYAGLGAPEPDARDPDQYRTVLTGDLGNDDGPGLTNNEENTYRVVLALGVQEAATLDGVTVTGGNANGGGLDFVFSGLFADDSLVTVRRCVFEGNHSLDLGGGMSSAYGARVTVVDCVFRHNDALRGGGLSAVAAEEIVIESSVFADNTAGLSGAGGAVFSSQCNPWIINCQFTGNSASTGGAMFNIDSARPFIVNSAFFGNAAATASALFVGDSGLARLDNCILWNNGAEAISGPVRVAQSCIEGGLAGIGNIDTDPMFVDPLNQNLRLSPGSPCIDSGGNRAVPRGVTTDLAGNPRFVDDPETADCPVPGASCGTAPIVDMGPHEFAPPIVGDFNGDLHVDLDDHAVFATCSGGPSATNPPKGCTEAQFDATDIDNDSDADLADFAVFQRQSIGSM